MGDGLGARLPVQKGLLSNTNHLLIGVTCRLPAERPVEQASILTYIRYGQKRTTFGMLHHWRP
jgi:hypothetical protein